MICTDREPDSTSFCRRLSMSSRACLDRRFSISSRSVRQRRKEILSWVSCEKWHKGSRCTCSSVCYLLLVLVEAWDQPYCWSVPASVRRSAAADSCTCAPTPPANRQTHRSKWLLALACASLGQQSFWIDKYLILELDAVFCQVLDLSEKLSFSGNTVLQGGKQVHMNCWRELKKHYLSKHNCKSIHW